MKTDIMQYEILTQGAVLLNHAYIYQGSKKVCAIGVDMKSKYVDLFTTGCDENDIPTVSVVANGHTLFVKKGVDRDAPTEIGFPEYKGWIVWSVVLSKYHIYICLVKPRSSKADLEKINAALLKAEGGTKP